ncbi:MAG: hypothetical protein K6B64_02340, partial [Acholeplasmatales bacterium]|nr:hypothetical protein [Acholeplasmatales bacterium]
LILGFIYLNSQFNSLDSVKSYAYIAALIGSSIFALCINIAINGLDVFYGNKYLLKNYIKRRKYILGLLCSNLVFIGIAYGLNIWWHNDLLAFFIGLLLTVILFYFQVFFMAKKSKLYEGE